MLERIIWHEYYFPDGYYGNMAIIKFWLLPKIKRNPHLLVHFGAFSYYRMPFGLYNAPAKFQYCVTNIFSNMVGRFLKVFMDDFYIFSYIFRMFCIILSYYLCGAKRRSKHSIGRSVTSWSNIALFWDKSFRIKGLKLTKQNLIW